MTDFNFKKAQKFLAQISQQKHFILPNIKYPYPTIKAFSILAKQFPDYFSQIIKRSNESNPDFHLEIQCPICKNIRQETVRRSRFITCVRNLDDITIAGCSYCRKKYFQENKIIKKLEYEEQQKNSLERSKIESEKYEKEKPALIEEYISSYLNPSRIWAQGISPYQKIQNLTCKRISTDQAISNYIKKMPYPTFLQTPYWKAVSEYKKKRADWKCELCHSLTSLNVHHKTYSIRGKEIFHLQDLIVLCEDCHTKFHDIS